MANFWRPCTTQDSCRTPLWSLFLWCGPGRGTPERHALENRWHAASASWTSEMVIQQTTKFKIVLCEIRVSFFLLFFLKAILFWLIWLMPKALMEQIQRWHDGRVHGISLCCLGKDLLVGPPWCSITSLPSSLVYRISYLHHTLHRWRWNDATLQPESIAKVIPITLFPVAAMRFTKK